MIKNPIIFAIAAVLVIVLGIQAYMIFQLNDRLQQLGGQENQAGSPQLKIPKLPHLNFPKQGSDDELFKDQPWSPYEEMQRMQKEMEQLFGDSFSRFHMNTPLGSLSKVPDVDLQEKSDQYVVTVNVPGADESSLEVKLEDRILHISIKTEHAEDQTDEKNGQYSFRERFMGEFHRTLTLPDPADAAKMKTDYHNGVLTITIPKK
ncbi:MAG: Hsp20/alpha crystallin family protein [Methylococcales bacterium]|nr:Hsp20/alpha crystallin family protein [Methylococcales bacterium]